MAVIAGHACSVAELMVPSIFMISSTQFWKSEARMAPLGGSPAKLDGVGKDDDAANPEQGETALEGEVERLEFQQGIDEGGGRAPVGDLPGARVFVSGDFALGGRRDRSDQDDAGRQPQDMLDADDPALLVDDTDIVQAGLIQVVHDLAQVDALSAHLGRRRGPERIKDGDAQHDEGTIDQ